MEATSYNWSESFADILKLNEPLHKHGTFKIGGNTAVLLSPKNNEQAHAIFGIIKANKFPYLILGGGSNVVLPDEQFDGVVVKLRNREFSIDGNSVYAQAGVILAQLAKSTAEAGLTGLEWGIGVPGAVGGAVRGNAGAFGGEIKDTLIKVTVSDGVTLRELTNSELAFSYRTSSIKASGEELMVLDATFELTPDDREACLARVKNFLEKKHKDQPFGEPSAGCLFKNIEVDGKTKTLKAPSIGNPTPKFLQDVPEAFWQNGKVPAGWLIDQLGLKGFQLGPMKISEKHGNFLVNTGGATAADVRQLAEYVKGKVFDAYGVQLVEEVQFI